MRIMPQVPEPGRQWLPFPPTPGKYGPCPVEAKDGAAGVLGGFSVWGSGDFHALFSSEEGSTDWKGDVSGFHLVADALLRSDLLAGFSVSRSNGSFEFTDRTDPVMGSGVYESRMITVHPYVNWSVREGFGLWATVGYGQGKVEIKEVDTTRTSDTKMTAAAAGFNVDLLTKDDLFLFEGGTTKLKFKGEDSFARVEVEGSNPTNPETRINPLTSDDRRSRPSLEASHERRLESGSIVTSSLEIGLCYDSGEGATGELTHYLSDTPDVAWAEFLRHEEIVDPQDLVTVRRAMWAVEIGEPPTLEIARPDDVLRGGQDSSAACQ